VRPQAEQRTTLIRILCEDPAGCDELIACCASLATCDAQEFLGCLFSS
jgi:hypothetical protein